MPVAVVAVTIPPAEAVLVTVAGTPLPDRPQGIRDSSFLVVQFLPQLLDDRQGLFIEEAPHELSLALESPNGRKEAWLCVRQTAKNEKASVRHSELEGQIYTALRVSG